MRHLLCTLFVFSLFINLAYADGPTSHEKSVAEKPYSSSFLPLLLGSIVSQTDPLNDDYSYSVNDLLKDSRMNLADRFDKARFAKIDYSKYVSFGGNKKAKDFLAIKPFYKKVMTKFPAFAWEGVCHQWSSAASDPVVNKALSGTTGLVCDGTILKKRDLKELFTANYSGLMQVKHSADGSQDWGIVGTRTNRNRPGEKRTYFQKWADDKIYDAIGMDTIHPHVLHVEMHKQLKQNKGLVIDADPGVAIANQPLYFADSVIMDVPRLSSDMPKIFSTQYLQATNKEGDEQLELLGKIEKALVAIADRKSKNMFTNIKKIIRKAGLDPKDILARDAWGKFRTVLGSPPSTPSYAANNLISVREDLFEEAVEKGNIVLNEKYDYFQVTTKVKFAMEVHYREKGYKEKEATWEYYLFKDKDSGKYVGGHWISKRKKFKRPDFLWIPRNETDMHPDHPGMRFCEHRAKLMMGWLSYEADPARGSKRRTFDGEDENSLVAFMTRGNFEGDISQNYSDTLNMALTDMLRLFKSCTQLKDATAMTEEFLSKMEELEDGYLYDLSKVEKMSLLKLYNKIVSTNNIPRIHKYIAKKTKKIQGLTLEKGKLVIYDWNKKTGACERTGHIAGVTKVAHNLCKKEKDSKISHTSIKGICAERSGLRTVREVPEILCKGNS